MLLDELKKPYVSREQAGYWMVPMLERKQCLEYWKGARGDPGAREARASSL